MPPQNKTEEILELTQILRSRPFNDMLNDMARYRQEKINKAVKEQNMVNAYGAYCELEVINKIPEMIEQRLKKAKEEK